MLLCFETILRLKVNLRKSEMVLVGVVCTIDSLASLLGCKVASLPIKYLGILLGTLLRLTLYGMGWLRKLKKC